MTKKEKEIISSVISELWKPRQKLINDHQQLDYLISSAKSDEERKKLILKRRKLPLLPSEENDLFAHQLFKLNDLLDSSERNEDVYILQKQMNELHAKKYITVSEFTKKYNFSKTSQQNYRQRLHDPLPYHQKVQNGKITYNVDEVEQWIENQHK